MCGVQELSDHCSRTPQQLKHRIRLGNDLQTAIAYCSQLVTTCRQGKDIVSTNPKLAKRLYEDRQLWFGVQILDKYGSLILPGPSAYTSENGNGFTSFPHVARLPSIQMDVLRT